MTLEAMISHQGLPALVLGGFLEGDAMGFLGGALAHQGLIRFEWAVLAIALGAMLADQAAFALGRFAQGSGLVRRARKTKSLERALEVLDKYPTLAVLGQRFVLGGRIVTAMAIGFSQLKWSRFLVLNGLAVLVWAHLVTALGYGVGRALAAMFGQFDLAHHLVATLSVGAVILSGLLIWHFRARS